MTLTLVTSSEVEEFLGLTGASAADKALAGQVAARVQAMLEGACNRAQAPFAPSATARVERHDGTGRPELWLDYPIVALTTVKLGHDPAAPDETLEGTDPQVLVWRTGLARLARVDGGVFGCAGAPLWVEVTYNAGADLPEDAALAVLRVTAALYNQRGAEDVRVEREGGYTGEMAAVAESDPVWQAAVAAHRRVAVR